MNHWLTSSVLYMRCVTSNLEGYHGLALASPFAQVRCAFLTFTRASAFFGALNYTERGGKNPDA